MLGKHYQPNTQKYDLMVYKRCVTSEKLILVQPLLVQPFDLFGFIAIAKHTTTLPTINTVTKLVATFVLADVGSADMHSLRSEAMRKQRAWTEPSFGDGIAQEILRDNKRAV